MRWMKLDLCMFIWDFRFPSLQDKVCGDVRCSFPEYVLFITKLSLSSIFHLCLYCGFRQAEFMDIFLP